MSELSTLNENAVSWAEIDCTINIAGGQSVKGVDLKSVNYESKVERGVQRGPGGKVKKRTTGQPTDSADAEFYRDGLRILKRAIVAACIAAGYVDSAGRPQLSKVTFDLVIKFAMDGDPEIYCTKLLGCHLDKTAFKHAEGTDADTVASDLNPIEIVEVIDGQDTVLL